MHKSLESSKTGTLYLVSTPIGNLEDITLRALRILKEADLIAAEDTRKTGFLLKHFGIQNALDSYHDHNKERKAPVMIRHLIQGRTIALVSDAGTPGISDPAYFLVRQAIASSVPVVPVPGATAAMAALIVSGLATDRFVFEGFLPAKKGRRARLDALTGEQRTIILYESPHRLLRTLQDLADTLGNREIAVCRELTKKFEECMRGPLSEITSSFARRRIQGEFVLIIQGGKRKK